MYQKIILIGNLGKDPEMHFNPDGKAITGFNVATSRKYRDTTETTWFRVSVFGQQAESCAKYLKKGSRVLVEGRLLRTPKMETRKSSREKTDPGAAAMKSTPTLCASSAPSLKTQL